MGRTGCLPAHNIDLKHLPLQCQTPDHKGEYSTIHLIKNLRVLEELGGLHLLLHRL